MNNDAERRGSAEPVLADLDRISGHGRSDDRLILVTIDGSGIPTELVIEPSAMRQAPSVLSAAIIEALQVAHEDLRAQVGQLLSEADVDGFLGTSSSSGEVSRTAADLSRAAADMAGEFDLTRRRLFDALDGM
ncbi:YbaB/EbfC family nucleoid-associated protein [Plantactinospora solaniradicis]|uniref:YbaB/EbfC family nucleoid-associated protein n=1 Tax=Plantactinospora solaniradicis TaxID=1723736 RepID=A0ABW1KFD0_9ACTN